MTKKKTKDQFIQEARAIHGDKYDYSLAEYKGNKTKVEIICNLCDEIFWQDPNSHIGRKSDCPKCSYKLRNDQKRKTQEQFINESKILFGDLEVV